MYCRSCGIEIPDTSRFCQQCGAATINSGFTSATGKPGRALSRPREDKKVAGVCSGIARYFGLDVFLVRIAMALLIFWPPGVGVIIYFVCWIIMPQDPLLLPPPRQTESQNAATV